MKNKLKVFQDIKVKEEEENGIYVYRFTCPNCKEPRKIYSGLQIIQSLFTCTCQAEFSCWCLHNKQLDSAFIKNIPSQESKNEISKKESK